MKNIKPSDFVVNDFEEIYEYDTKSRPRTPSYWDEKGVTYKQVTQIDMTAGGGMGGSYWSEFVERIDLDDLVQKRYLITKKWDGETIALNLNYMVKAKQVTIASAILHSQNHNFPEGAYTYNWLVNDGQKVELID